ncbi:MAG: M48 family metallopeptidase [Bacteroidota bacterium]
MANRTNLYQISSQAWEHPADRAALNTLRKIPALDTMLQRFFGGTTERSLRLLYVASAVRTSDKQFSRLHALFGEACEILDLERPELYVSQSPFYNAMAVGMDRPFVVVNSSIAKSLDDEEMLAVMGHELGHILSGHVLYKTLLNFLITFSQRLIRFPITDLAMNGLIIALNEWSRKSELSCDRAELLTVQNPDVPIRALMKMAGGDNMDEMDLGEFLAQADEYNESDTIGDSFHKVMNVLYQSHPFAVVRASELMKWVRSGEYDRILSGDYTRRGEDEDIFDNYKSAANAYREDFSEATRPLDGAFKAAGEGVNEAARRAKDIMDGFFGGKKA